MNTAIRMYFDNDCVELEMFFQGNIDFVFSVLDSINIVPNNPYHINNKVLRTKLIERDGESVSQNRAIEALLILKNHLQVNSSKYLRLC